MDEAERFDGRLVDLGAAKVAWRNGSLFGVNDGTSSDNVTVVWDRLIDDPGMPVKPGDDLMVRGMFEWRDVDGDRSPSAGELAIRAKGDDIRRPDG